VCRRMEGKERLEQFLRRIQTTRLIIYSERRGKKTKNVRGEKEEQLPRSAHERREKRGGLPTLSRTSSRAGGRKKGSTEKYNRRPNLLHFGRGKGRNRSWKKQTSLAWFTRNQRGKGKLLPEEGKEGPLRFLLSFSNRRRGGSL